MSIKESKMHYLDIPDSVYIIGSIENNKANIEAEQCPNDEYWLGVWTDKKQCMSFKNHLKYERPVTKIPRKYLDSMLYNANINCLLPNKIRYVCVNLSANDISPKLYIVDTNKQYIIDVIDNEEYLNVFRDKVIKQLDSIEDSIDRILNTDPQSMPDPEELSTTLSSFIKENDTTYSYVKNIANHIGDNYKILERYISVLNLVKSASAIIEQIRISVENGTYIVKHSRYITKEVRREVWVRDNGCCADCGSTYKIEYDHIIPVSKGGSNSPKNIELLCLSCNRKKSDKNPGFH